MELQRFRERERYCGVERGAIEVWRESVGILERRKNLH